MQLFQLAWFVFIVKCGLHLLLADYFLHCTGKQERPERNFHLPSQNHTHNPGEVSAFLGLKYLSNTLGTIFIIRLKRLQKNAIINDEEHY
jgi:hypothetical protein